MRFTSTPHAKAVMLTVAGFNLELDVEVSFVALWITPDGASAA
jgi:hypothetical protein